MADVPWPLNQSNKCNCFIQWSDRGSVNSKIWMSTLRLEHLQVRNPSTTSASKLILSTASVSKYERKISLTWRTQKKNPKKNTTESKTKLKQFLLYSFPFDGQYWNPTYSRLYLCHSTLAETHLFNEGFLFLLCHFGGKNSLVKVLCLMKVYKNKFISEKCNNQMP